MYSLGLFLSSAVILSPALAAPQIIIPPAVSDFCPIVDKDGIREVNGKPWQAGVVVPGGGTVSLTQAYSVSTSWSVGADLGVNPGSVSLGLGVSASETITVEVGEGVSHECPKGRWRCGLVIIPGMVRISGRLEKDDPQKKCELGVVHSWEGGEAGKKFEFDIPRKDKAKNPDWTYDICTCKNYEGWADPGHVAKLCPENC